MHRDGTARRDIISSFLGNGTSLTGELHFDGTLRIDGNFQGSIQTSGTLILGVGAIIDGAIRAGEVQIFGRVLGTIDCDRRAKICKGGTLQGEVRTPSLVIEDGAKFEGVSQAVPDSAHDESRLEPEAHPSREMEIEPEQSLEALHPSAVQDVTWWAQVKSGIQRVLTSTTD